MTWPQLAAALLGSAVALTPHRVLAQVPSAFPTRETHPVPHGGDAADDPALWLHPTAPASSLMIGSDKDGGIGVYDLTGAELQFLPHGELNNVDVRYNFSLDGQTIDLVVASNRTNDSIAVYRIDPDPVGSQWLVPAGVIPVSPFVVYGICLYADPDTFFAFLTSEAGNVEQWQLVDAGTGLVGGTKVRSFDVGSSVEACVADDEQRSVYFAEESTGIWRYGAEPGDGSARSLVDGTGPQGHLTADVEGLAVYHGLGGSGFLMASSQGSSDYVLYERMSGAYVGSFRIGAGNGIDGTSDTDGIEVTNASLGPGFPGGLFIAQDGLNSDPAANQNFKLVPWESIAQAFDPPLDVATGWNPRPQCRNWIDDDGDGGVDWDGGGAGAPDPQCVNRPWRDREARHKRCGLGFELALPLAGLLLRSKPRATRAPLLGSGTARRG